MKPKNCDRMPLSMNLATISPISPATINSQARYIVVAIDYFIKWAEAKATHKVDARSTAKFLYEQVIRP